MRFIDGGKESFLATYAYLANAAEEENYSEFTEAIVFCLEHYEQYNLVTQIAIADLVRCYGYRLKDLNVDRMINAINAVYPTRNLLLDVIFSEFTIYKSYLLKCVDKHSPDYLEQEDMIRRILPIRRKIMLFQSLRKDIRSGPETVSTIKI